MQQIVIRPATEADLEAMGRITAASYHAVDARLVPREWPDPVPRPPSRTGAWMERTRTALATDPGGCWVADVDGEVVGCAISRIREGLWILSSFAVRGDLQGRGVGAQLLAAALSYGRGCLRGMFASSADPAAVRRYRLAGFDLHPQLVLRGVLDRAALPAGLRVRDGNENDRDLMDSVDRATRGAAHGPDHDVLLRETALVVADRPHGQGYAYTGTSRSPVLLAATSRRIAEELMWEALARTAPGAEVSVPHVTAANQWALDVGLAARLSTYAWGYLCLRTMKPPRHYLHHGSLL